MDFVEKHENNLGKDKKKPGEMLLKNLVLSDQEKKFDFDGSIVRE